MTIEEQVEQFRQKFQPDPLTDMHGFDVFAKEYYALLRQVVEECCKAKCSGCRDGYELIQGDNLPDDIKPNMPGQYWHYHDGSNLVCWAQEIRRHFAWLSPPKESPEDAERGMPRLLGDLG